MTDQSTRPSNAQQPDLDWSQVRETIRMLFLAVAQIEIAMTESDDSVDHLTTSFTTMVAYEKNIALAVDELPDSEDTRVLRGTISHNADKVTDEMQSAIVAFQFYDKLTQRLAHVSSALESLSELVGDSSKIYNPAEWQKLQQTIKSRYSMREEHEMFDSVMAGSDIRGAVRQYYATHNDNHDDDIEFF